VEVDFGLEIIYNSPFFIIYELASFPLSVFILSKEGDTSVFL